MSEHLEQVAFFEWISLNRGRFPQLKLCYAIPNGGHRHIAVARRMKAEGVQPGVPDIALDYPAGKFHGLRIEMKVKGGRLTDEQKRWHYELTKAGYKVAVCWSAEEAIEQVAAYLTCRTDENVIA